MTTTDSGSDETRGRTLAVARAAFGHFCDALTSGNWAPFLACLTDDFEFWFPTGRFKGRHAGTAAAADFFAYVSTVYPGGLFVTLDRVMASETSVAFEFRDTGLLFGRDPYANRVVIVLDVRGDHICGYRDVRQRRDALAMLPTSVSVVYVGPRDGLQLEPSFIDTGVKIELVHRIAEAGVRRIEVTSFVSPAAMPQMRDADAVMRGITRRTPGCSVLGAGAEPPRRRTRHGRRHRRAPRRLQRHRGRESPQHRAHDRRVARGTRRHRPHDVGHRASRGSDPGVVRVPIDWRRRTCTHRAPGRPRVRCGRHRGVRGRLVRIRGSARGRVDGRPAACGASRPAHRAAPARHARPRHRQRVRRGPAGRRVVTRRLRGRPGRGRPRCSSARVGQRRVRRSRGFRCEECGVHTGIDAGRLSATARYIAGILGRPLPGRLHSIGTRHDLFAAIAARGPGGTPT